MTIGVILAQSRPTDTNATSVYSPPKGVKTEITQVVVAETAGGTPTYRVFLDNDGTTYDQTTALFYDVATSANSSSELISHGSWWMTNPNGNLAVRTSVGSQLTFTVFGIEHQI